MLVLLLLAKLRSIVALFRAYKVAIKLIAQLLLLAIAALTLTFAPVLNKAIRLNVAAVVFALAATCCKTVISLGLRPAIAARLPALVPTIAAVALSMVLLYSGLLATILAIAALTCGCAIILAYNS